MDLIKRTPNETHSPLPLEYMEAGESVNTTYPYSLKNPMLPWHKFYEALGNVSNNYHRHKSIPVPEDIRRFVSCVRLSCIAVLGKIETERIVNKTKERAHAFSGLELPDSDHQPRYGYDPDGNGVA